MKHNETKITSVRPSGRALSTILHCSPGIDPIPNPHFQRRIRSEMVGADRLLGREPLLLPAKVAEFIAESENIIE